MTSVVELNSRLRLRFRLAGLGAGWKNSDSPVSSICIVSGKRCHRTSTPWIHQVPTFFECPKSNILVESYLAKIHLALCKATDHPIYYKLAEKIFHGNDLFLENPSVVCSSRFTLLCQNGIGVRWRKRRRRGGGTTSMQETTFVQYILYYIVYILTGWKKTVLAKSISSRGGTRLPSECDYLQKNSSLWRLSIGNRHKRKYSAVDCAADCHP